MNQFVPIPFLLISVTVLIWAELTERRKVITWIKPVSTLLVMVVAALAWHHGPDVDGTYVLWILVGLALSMVGDVALMFTSSRAFLIGLVGFLLAHVAYATVLTWRNGFHPQDAASGAVLVILMFVLYRYLLPGLGRMRVPVLLYMIVICFMLNRAISTLYGDHFSGTQAWLIAAGAFSFWVSDIILGINRFGRPIKHHRFSLAFYYAGQLMIALSTGPY